ncbi:MAG: FecR family protein [Bacteroidales bacterium]|nr:FecR family protein [Bacteroidales bacterium]
MIKASKHIDHLITRYLSGEASSTERLHLEQWLNESEINRKYFDQIKFIHEKATKTYPEIDFDVDKAWGNVKDQMKFTPKVDIKVRKIQWGWLSVAASIVALIGISAIVYFNTGKKTIAPVSDDIAIASQDSSVSQKLPDKTQVYLNKKSKIAYSPNYGKKNREITLIGEAYFNATHSKDKPLTIKAEDTYIKDIGTSFNIKAYPNEDVIEVYVENGKVVFYSEKDSGITLVKGDVGVYSKKTNTFSKKIAVEPNILSYKTKSFTFINAKLLDVVRQLNSVYSTQIHLKNPDIERCTINVSFEDESIETIANVISETLNLKLSKTSEGYILDGVKCNNP